MVEQAQVDKPIDRGLDEAHLIGVVEGDRCRAAQEVSWEGDTWWLQAGDPCQQGTREDAALLSRIQLLKIDGQNRIEATRLLLFFQGWGWHSARFLVRER